MKCKIYPSILLGTIFGITSLAYPLQGQPVKILPDRIGIGTEAPFTSLDVRGDIHFFDNALISSAINGTSVTDLTGNNVDHIWHDDATNIWHFLSDAPYRGIGNANLAAGQIRMSGGGINYVLGNLGVGVSNPTSRLHVNGNVLFRGKLDVAASASDLNSLFVGRNAGLNDDGTDNQNTFLGVEAGASNTSGYFNTASGYQALFSNTTGEGNTAIGNSALFLNSDGIFNTALGQRTLYNNTSGYDNTATGTQALSFNTTGYRNTSSGKQAMYFNTTGYRNTATGYHALQFNSTGSNNTASGSDALNSNSTGSFNTAVGVAALYRNTTRSNLVAVGDSALYNNGVGAAQSFHATGNTAVGSKALFSNTTGPENTAIGYQALFSNTTGWQNTAVGYQTLYNGSGTGNTAVGHQALVNNTGAYNTAIGWGALTTPFGGVNNTAVGVNAEVSTNIGAAGVFGENAIVTATNSIVIGRSGINSVGGYVPWSELSDGRFKEDVKEEVPGMTFIRQLRPVTYTVNLDKLQRHITAQMPDNIAARYLPTEEDQAKARQNIRTGFIAQEVEALAQKIGYNFDGVNAPTNPTDKYSIAYSRFVPSLVKALQEQEEEIKEQQEEIETQQKEIDDLKARLARLEAHLAQNTATPDGAATDVLLRGSDRPDLRQNVPNPFGRNTVIGYYLPERVTGAHLRITDQQGRTLKMIRLEGTGEGQVNLTAEDMPDGAYSYSLIVDGQLFATRQMVLVK